MDPPIQTEYFLSGGAMILILMVDGGRAAQPWSVPLYRCPCWSHPRCTLCLFWSHPRCTHCHWSHPRCTHCHWSHPRCTRCPCFSHPRCTLYPCWSLLSCCPSCGSFLCLPPRVLRSEPRVRQA